MQELSVNSTFGNSAGTTNCDARSPRVELAQEGEQMHAHRHSIQWTDLPKLISWTPIGSETAMLLAVTSIYTST